MCHSNRWMHIAQNRYTLLSSSNSPTVVTEARTNTPRWRRPTWNRSGGYTIVTVVVVAMGTPVAEATRELLPLGAAEHRVVDLHMHATA